MTDTININGLLANDLDAFLNFLYEGLTGFVTVAELHRSSDKEYMKHNFYLWPEQRLEMRNHIKAKTEAVDVFICPAVYSHSVAKREYFKASNVSWVEFDDVPNFTGHKPTLRLQSSGPGREHWYYRMVSRIESYDELERYNKALAYTLGGDHSWAANKLLRPVGGVNHKYTEKPKVTVLNVFDLNYPANYLDEGWTDPASNVFVQEAPAILPDIGETLLKYAWTDKASELLRQNSCPPNTRSDSLMALGYHMAEMGISEAEMLAVLIYADDKWGKFKDRADRIKRLSEIVVIAKQKHPKAIEANETNPTSMLDDLVQRNLLGGWIDILNANIEFNWIVEDLLLKDTNLILGGRQNVGKSQLSMRFGMAMALGKDEFLGYRIVNEQKILFLSLELGIVPIKLLLSSMNNDLTNEDREKLQEQFIIAPIGEAMKLYTTVGQEQLLTLIDKIRPTGLIVDSIGKTISSPSNEEQAIGSSNFLNHLNNLGMFVWGIHHVRKTEQGGRTKPPELDDIYGNQYLTAFARSAYGLYLKDGDLRFKQLKNNFAKDPEGALRLQRTPALNFNVLDTISNTEEEEESQKPKLFGE